MEVARLLASAPTDEPRLRAAVSRAYYAIFLMVRDKAHITGKDSVHERAKIAVAARRSPWPRGVLRQAGHSKQCASFAPMRTTF